MPATSPFKIANYNYIFLDTSIILNSHLNLDKLEDFKTAAHNNNDLPQVTEFDKKIKTVKDCQLLLKQIVAHSKTNK